MGDTTWKKFERQVAREIFGSERNPGSGKSNRDDEGTPRSGDVIHNDYEIECKLRKSIAIFRWWDKLKDDATESGKIPILVIREVGDAQDVLVVTHYKFFKELLKAWEGKKDEYH